MPYTFDATTDFFTSIDEIDILLAFANDNDNVDKRNLFLKLSIVSLVTKLQIYIEKVLDEYIYRIINSGIKSNCVSIHMRMNSLQLSVLENNIFDKLTKHKNFSQDKLDRIIAYVNSIDYVLDDEKIIGENFKFRTQFSLGKTGKNELVQLFRQIDGNEHCFNEIEVDGEAIDFNSLDTLLQLRHSVVHRDAFSGTDVTVAGHRDFCKKLAKFIDNYLREKLKSCIEI